MDEKPWFDEIGLAYAKHYADLEDSRAAFEDQRHQIIAHLAPALDEAIADSTAECLSSSNKDDYCDRYLDGQFEQCRLKHRQKKKPGTQSGLSARLTSWPAGDTKVFGFMIDAWFGYHHKQLARVPRPELDQFLATVELKPDGGITLRHQGSFSYFELCRIPWDGDGFDLDSMEEATSNAVDAYLTLDPFLAMKYRERFSLEE